MYSGSRRRAWVVPVGRHLYAQEAKSPLFVLPLAVPAGAGCLRAILGVLGALAGVGMLFSWR
ncbi:hypothetical protein [Kamptonema formosum]|uniref:hypothetical protein n=1 Tax=Kamptonema formosum TaxID=331992 RepID=UPI000349CD94|nr:hypothetical protein [Oscillatoria sp. PCC 10802]